MVNRTNYVYWFVLLITFIVNKTYGSLEPGRFDFDITEKDKQIVVSVEKSAFAGTNVYVELICGESPETSLNITWKIIQLPCWMRMPNNDESMIASKTVYAKCVTGANIPLTAQIMDNSPGINIGKKDKRSDSDDSIKVDEKDSVIRSTEKKEANHLIYKLPNDGIYGLKLEILHGLTAVNVSAHVSIRSEYGYLSAADYPLMAFYGAMCLVYVVFGIIWLMVSALQWRDLLRIQFWIGGVILLGMLEKAVFYAEHQNVNSTGNPTKSIILIAEWVSCGKRTLARMLVIIVSLGFGIVKPRLGPMLHRVVGTGALYFTLACVESYLRVNNTQDDNKEILVASIPLAVLDSAICWWIFTSLVQTTRTLRLRRNMVKIALYRHFTNTLIFAVIASIIFMLFSIKKHHMGDCLREWKGYWQDEAFWHVLFSSLLLVIMILWRPTNNNQRYAFTPLLDNPEDEDDDDEEDQFIADVYGVKMRSNRSTSPKRNRSKATTTEEDDLRWVEDNIPTAINDSALPILDSDEEIINTRFEVSKMQ